MKILLTIVILSIVTFSSVLSQPQSGNGMGGSGTISGTLKDNETRHAIEYGNVVLFRVRDSVMVTGTISGNDGKFILPKIPFGRYYLKVSFIGYETRLIKQIALNPKTPEVELDVIYLQLTPVNLKEIVISGEKEMIINNLDKKVINVDKNMAATGGSAVDIMQTIPAITVDAEGGIKLRGNKNVTVLIDGRPSAMEGVSSGEILAQIPASSMEAIELVTNPSAKYDPEGTSGIVNIVLKKKQEIGYNSVVTVNAGTGDRYNGSVNLNYRMNNWNFYGSFDARWNRFGSEGTEQQTSYPPFSSNLDQDSRNQNIMNMNGLRTGIDYSSDEWNTWSIGLRTRNMAFNNSGDINSVSTINGLPTQYFTDESDAQREGHHLEYSLEHKRTFETKGREWTSNFEVENQTMNRDETRFQKNYGTDQSMIPGLSKQRVNGSNKAVNIEFESNYSHPTLNWGRFEVGFKSRLKNMESTSDLDTLSYISNLWAENANKSDKFDYKEQVHAIYSTYSNLFYDFKYQVALRGELALTTVSSIQFSNDFKNDYTSIYPSLHISREFLDLHEVMVSYSRRVDRPNNRQLNPFVDYSNSRKIRSGNPALKPQYTDAMELGYSFNLQGTSLSAALFYRTTEDMISEITRLESGDITRTSLQNSATGVSSGIDFSFNQTIAKWWRVNGGVSWFRNVITGNLGSDNADADNVSWTAKGTSMVTLPWEVQFQLMGNYNAPTVGPQRKTSAQYSMDMGLRKDFLDGMLTANLRVSDVFDTREWDSETNGSDFSSTSYSKPESRTVFLGLTWRLSTLMQAEREKQRNRDQENNDDF
ncbi:MAG: TonB-dependent receptor [Bacteroidetes bacterium]|nr:TonB-dependent receptor [Bacteroidota bacterium]